MTDQAPPTDTAMNALLKAGLPESSAGPKSNTLNTLLQAAARVNPEAPKAYYVPGRIEVLGKHVDYAGGQSLTCATEQGFLFVATPRDDWRVRLIDPLNNLDCSFPLDPELRPLAGDWTNYPMTVARRVARNFKHSDHSPLKGCDIVFTSDLPQAAGLSSSSAMITGLFMVIAERNGLGRHPAFKSHIASDVDLAGYLGSIENGSDFGTLTGDLGVGTKGGSQDHTAILCAHAGAVSRFRYRPVELIERVAMPEDSLFAIGVSGVHSQKTLNTMQQYNRASELATEAVGVWQEQTGRKDEHLAAAADSSPNAPDQLLGLLGNHQALHDRARQFLLEYKHIVPGACDALKTGDLTAFGTLADASQDAAENLLGNQVPQTVHLARQARTLGAQAASAFGAGFGGSVWALIQRDEADRFLTRWREDYEQAYPDESEVRHVPHHPAGAGRDAAGSIMMG